MLRRFGQQTVFQQLSITVTTTTSSMMLRGGSQSRFQSQGAANFSKMASTLGDLAGAGGGGASSSSGGGGGGDDSSSGGSSSDSGSSFNGGVGTVATGLIFLGAGIVAINVTDRRAAKQEILNDFCENRVYSVNEAKPVPETEAELEDKILHLHGDVDYKGQPPRDEALGVATPDAIRLKREVEMYQWKETKHETKNKDGGKDIHYTYSKQWADHHLSTHDSRNPGFPHYDAVKEADELWVTVLKNLHFKLSTNFVERLRNWTGKSVQVTDSSAALHHGLAPLPKGRGFYTDGKSESSPEVGDVKVTYKAVNKGPFTMLGKWQSKEPHEIVPFSAKLDSTLASQAPLAIPQEAHDAAKKAGSENGLIIPEWVIELTENTILRVAPIEFAFAEPGHHTKVSTIAHHRTACEDTTETLLIIGGLFCCIGCAMMASPASMVVGGSTAGGAGFVTGIGIAYNTHKEAQARAEKMVHSQPKWATDGKSDVRL